MLQTRRARSGNLMGMPEVGRVSGKYGRFLDQAKQDAALAALRARQHAILGLGSALRNWAFPRGRIQKRTVTNRLRLDAIHVGKIRLRQQGTPADPPAERLQLTS
jgi:hypothetical protein